MDLVGVNFNCIDAYAVSSENIQNKSEFKDIMVASIVVINAFYLVRRYLLFHFLHSVMQFLQFSFTVHVLSAIILN